MLLQNWWLTTLLGDAPMMEPPLVGRHDTDVLVIGGGAAGLAAAARLRRAGRSVILVERNICGGSTTGQSSGFLTPDSELELSQLVRRYGDEVARKVWESPLRGIETMRALVEGREREVDLVPLDSMFLARRGDREAAKDEHDARVRLGYGSRLLEGDALAGAIGSTSYDAAVRYSGTYGINGLRYAQAVKTKIIQAGARVYEASEVVRLKGTEALTHLGRIRANEVILCLDAVEGLQPDSERAFPVQTFLSVSEPLSQTDRASLFPSGAAMCWDSRLVYTYFRPTGDGRLLLGGGTIPTTYTPRTVHAQHSIARVHARFRADFPQLAHLQFIQYWPGRISTTRDLLPTILRTPQEHTHAVLGAPGLPWATFCGDLAARAVLGDVGEDEDHLQRFAPTRAFPVPLGIRRMLGRPYTFALSHAWAKYRQKDRS